MMEKGQKKGCHKGGEGYRLQLLQLINGPFIDEDMAMELIM